MRLLQVVTRNNTADFSLVEYVGRHIPAYAILSHTWGPDEDEVSFQDIMQGNGKEKRGYRKLEFCGKQANEDGLRFFWVDTCCIDKSSSTDLTEAINSMFCWYQKAAKCYVYLSDVSLVIPQGYDTPRTNSSIFEQSRWFRRGWTLQELLAPSSVAFFDKNCQRIGDKNTMVKDIQKITGINERALRGEPLSSFSVDERFSWAEHRQTKRDEDAAYSLLGIFGIHMSHYYGEGKAEAFNRLRKKIRKASMLESQSHPPTPPVSSARGKPIRFDEALEYNSTVLCFKCGFVYLRQSRSY
jgi:hypothetical protein